MTPIFEIPAYRVVVIQPGSEYVCAVHVEDGYSFPIVETPIGCRLAKQIQEVMLSRWCAEIFILELISEMGSASGFAIAEQTQPCTHSALVPVQLDQLSEQDLADGVQDKIAEVRNRTADSSLPQIGWCYEVSRWIETVSGYKLCSHHGPKQFNAGGVFSLLRFQTVCGRTLWFKATGEPNAHEFPVSRLLSKIGRPYVPEVIAVKPEWNAWLMSDEGIDIATQQPEHPDTFLVGAARSLASLQVATIGKQDALIDAGAFDQRCDVLERKSDVLFEYIAESMGLQTSTNAPQLEIQRVDELREFLFRVADRISALRIPDCVLHGDLNFGNLLSCNGHCQFIDWCEAYVGHPLIALQHLLLLGTSKAQQHERSNEAPLIAAYTSEFEAVCDPASIAKALPLMSFLAAVSALYGSGRWLKTSIRQSPNRQRFARTLARQMNHAAMRTEFRAAIGR